MVALRQDSLRARLRFGDHCFEDFETALADKAASEASLLIYDDRSRKLTTVILTANRVSRIQENGIVYLARFDGSFHFGMNGF